MAKDRRIDIKLVVDNDQAKQTRAEELRGYREMARVADQQAKLAAKSQIDATRTAMTEQGKAQRQAVDLAAKSARQQADIHARAARQSADIQAREARRAADVTAREAKRAADTQAREATRAAKAQMKAAADATKAAKEAAEGIGAQSVDRFVGSLGKVAIGFVGLSTASKTIDAIADSFGKAREQAMAFGAEILKAKEDMRELATLKGMAFASDEFIRKQADFSRQTGMTLAESDAFQRNVLGSAAGGLQKGNIDEATLDKVMVEAGRTAVRQTKDVGTRGDLIGLLPQFRKYDKGDAGVKQLLGDAEAVRLGLTEGRGDDAPLTKAFASVAGSLISDGGKGMLPSAPELAATLGVTSLASGPAGADTRTEQLIRGVRGDTPKQIEFMKSTFGIDEHDNLEKRLNKVIPKLREIEKGGRDIPTYLTESGLPGEQVRAITEMMPNLEMWNKRLAMARRPGQGDQVIADNAQYFGHEPAGRYRMARAATEAARVTAGIPNQDIIAETEAERAKAIPESTGMGYWLGNKLLGAATLGQVPGENVRLEHRAVQSLKDRTGMPAPSDAAMMFPPFNMLPGFITRPFMSMVGAPAVDAQMLRAVEESQPLRNVRGPGSLLDLPATSPGSGSMPGTLGGLDMSATGGPDKLLAAIERQTNIISQQTTEFKKTWGQRNMGPKVLPKNTGRVSP